MRLVGVDGAQRGVFSVLEAEKIARDEGLDLVLVTDKAEIPVVKLADYNKFLYEQKKELKEKKKPKQQLKEIKISFTEAEGDMARKAKKIDEFLEEGSVVQIRLTMKGRQRMHAEFAQGKLRVFLEKVAIPYKLVNDIKKENAFLAVTIAKNK